MPTPYNKTLGYIYYILGLLWLVGGGGYFIFVLESFHRDFITAVYGVLIFAGIVDLGYLHQKIYIPSIFFSLLSTLNLSSVAFLGMLLIWNSPDTGLLMLMMASIVATASGLTLLLGTFAVRKTWRKASIITPVLIASIIVWTIVFITF